MEKGFEALAIERKQEIIFFFLSQTLLVLRKDKSFGSIVNRAIALLIVSKHLQWEQHWT